MNITDDKFRLNWLGCYGKVQINTKNIYSHKNDMLNSIHCF